MLCGLQLKLSLSKLSDLVPAAARSLMRPSTLLRLSLDTRESLLHGSELLIGQIGTLTRRQIVLLKLEQLFFQLDDFAFLLFVGSSHLLHVHERCHGHGARHTGRRKAFSLLCIEELVEIGSLLVSATLLLLF